MATSSQVLRVMIDLYASIKHQGAEVPIAIYTDICDPISQLEEQISLFYETLTAMGSEDSLVAAEMRNAGLLA
jgi:hypothetical protein